MLLLVDELHDARIIQAKGRRVDVLSVGVVAHDEDFWLTRVIDVEGEVIASHYPVECRGDHTRERDLCRGDLSLELVLCSAFPGIHKGGQVVSELIVGGEDGEDLGVGSVEELDGMGEGTVPASLVDLEEPDDGRQQDDGRLDEEVSLLLYPCPVQVEHDGVGGLVGIGDVRHEGGIDRVTAMRLARVVEVDDEELRLHLIGIEVCQEMVVGDLREVWELVIVDVHGESLLDLLFDVVIDYGEGLPRARGSKYHGCTEGIDNVDPSLVPSLFVVEAGR